MLTPGRISIARESPWENSEQHTSWKIIIAVVLPGLSIHMSLDSFARFSFEVPEGSLPLVMQELKMAGT